MQKLQFPAPVYIFISETSILVRSQILNEDIGIRSRKSIYENLDRILQGVWRESSKQKPEIIVHSNNEKIIEQFNYESGLYDIQETKVFMDAKAICKKLNLFRIEYKQKPDIPVLSKKEIEVQTIKEMIEQSRDSAGALIVPEDLTQFQCLDMSTGKPLVVENISADESISKKFISKKQTVFDHPTNKMFPMEPEDKIVYCKYDSTSMQYSFPPGRIGVVAPFENIKLIF